MADLAEVPPERHADRVVGQMLGELIAKRYGIYKAIVKAFKDSSDGNPRAQERMASRIRKAGAIDVTLGPGTNGRYTMTIMELTGWNPATCKELGPDDPIPDKPWLALIMDNLKSHGHKKKLEYKSYPLLFFTHHAWSRCAVRFGLRHEHEIIAFARNVWMELLRRQDDFTPLFEPPPAGWRIPVGGDVIACMQKHDRLVATLVVTTLLIKGEEV